VGVEEALARDRVLGDHVGVLGDGVGFLLVFLRFGGVRFLLFLFLFA